MNVETTPAGVTLYTLFAPAFMYTFPDGSDQMPSMASPAVQMVAKVVNAPVVVLTL